MKMKALSISQPWAWAILYAGKWIENRKWNTNFRSWFLIHAAKSWDQRGYDYLKSLKIYSLPPREEIRAGGIVGIGKINNVITEGTDFWFEGPYGFVIKHSRPLPFRACPGRQRFFNIELPKQYCCFIDDVIYKKIQMEIHKEV